MKPVSKIYICNEDGTRFFGEGPYRLLVGVREYGSLRSSAAQMNMAYTKALELLQTAESSLGYPLMERKIGGKGGGGSFLTPAAEQFLAKYEQYRDACKKINMELFGDFFGTEEGEEEP